MSNLPDLAGRTVLQVIPALNAGGAERTVVEITEALTRAGARALIASEGGRLENQVKDVGGELLYAPLSSLNPIKVKRNVARLITLIDDECIDLVHARSRAPAWPSHWAARARQKPFVTTYHGAYSAPNWLKRKYNSIMVRADRVIANSDWTAEQIESLYAVTPPQLVTIPRGIDARIFCADAVDPERALKFRQAWTPQGMDGPTILLLPGRLTAWKGQIEAVEAFSLIPEAVSKNAILVLAGPVKTKGDYLARLHRLMAEKKLERRVQISNDISDMPAAILAADIVLAPSTRPEAFGRTAPEASAMGRPVIVSDHGGARETVVHEQTGLRVPPGDVPALAEAMRRMLEMSAAERETMGNSGQSFVSKRFSLEGLQAATLSVYAELLGKGAG